MWGVRDARVLRPVRACERLMQPRAAYGSRSKLAPARATTGNGPSYEKAMRLDPGPETNGTISSSSSLTSPSALVEVHAALPASWVEQSSRPTETVRAD